MYFPLNFTRTEHLNSLMVALTSKVSLGHQKIQTDANIYIS